MTAGLVTGGHGFVGSHLVPLLRHRGWTITVLGRRPDPDPSDERYLQVDLTDADAVAEAVDLVRPDVVFHLAASAGQESIPVEALVADAVLATVNLCGALRRVAQPVRLVLAGSSAQYGSVPLDENPVTEETRPRPAGPYGHAKLAAEAAANALAADGRIELIPARAFNHVGPGEPARTVAGALARRVAAVLDGRASRVEASDIEVVRDFTDVRDIAKGYLALAEHGVPGRPYNLCSGRATNVAAVVDGLLAHAGLDRSVVDILPDRGGLEYQVGSPARARADVQWEAELSLDRSLADLLAECRRATAGSGERAQHEDRT